MCGNLEFVAQCAYNCADCQRLSLISLFNEWSHSCAGLFAQTKYEQRAQMHCGSCEGRREDSKFRESSRRPSVFVYKRRTF